MPATFDLKRCMLCALALALAWLSQTALAGPRPGDGWALLLAALALFGFALREVPVLVPLAGSPGEALPATAPAPQRRVQFLLGLSLLSTALSLAAFLSGSTLGLAWVLHLAALLLFIAAFLPSPAVLSASVRRLHPFRLPRARLAEGAALVLVLCAALAMRVWQLGTLPEGLMADEALYGLVARRILHEPGFVPPAYMEYIQRPPHYAYLVALLFQLFGDSAASIRLVSVLFGLAGIVAAYLLFSRWFGRSTLVGLLAAGLLAVLRYDVTFSRIAIDGISTPFFIMLTLFFLSRGLMAPGPQHRAAADLKPAARGLERARRADFAAAGLTLGLSLQFYLPMRIFIALLVALGVAALLRLLLRRGFSASRMRSAWRAQVLPWGPPLLCAALGLFTAAAPLGLEALREPGVVFERQYSASIFFEPEEPDLLKRVVNNTLKHLEMFNGPGDRFGRDNLPGAPMLDPLLGILCVLGLGAALARPRAAVLQSAAAQCGRREADCPRAAGLQSAAAQCGRREADCPRAAVLPSAAAQCSRREADCPRELPTIIMLGVFGAMLLAGILSWDKEAPDALRTIGVLPTLIYFVLLALRGLSVLARRFIALLPARCERPGAVALVLLAVIGFGWIGYAELDTYFNQQMRNTEVWAAHDIGATWIGREMARLGSGNDYRIAPVYWGRPTIDYYAPLDRPLLWQDADRVSQLAQSDKPVVLFLDYWHQGAVAEARAIEPAVPVLELVPPGGGPTYVYEVILSKETLRRLPPP